MSDDLSNESTTNDSSPLKIRDVLSSSARGGHNGGYRPKKKFQHLIESLEGNDKKTDDNENIDCEMDDNKEENDGAILASEIAKVDLTDDAEDLKSEKSDDDSSDSSGIDLTLARDPKRCDFCGDLSHKSRFCSVLGGQRNDRGAGGVRTCFQCHEEGHIRVDCPKRIATCFLCHKQGHVKADCPKRNNMESKKRERVTYTFRKPSSQKEEKDNIPPVKDVYEIRSSGGEDDNDTKRLKDEEKPQHRIFVPLPVAASQIKKPVMLRSKLLSSDSEPSISHKIVRSESSEEEDEMESCHESDDNNDKNNEGKNILKDKIILNEEDIHQKNSDKEGKTLVENGDELQTISVEIDGCVEFDTDDDSSYLDCSEGEEGNDEKGLKRIMEEEDECYGEDGALIDEDIINN